MFKKLGTNQQIHILPGEEERASKALEALEEDPHAPREISLRFTLHVHNEFPKLVYKGSGASQKSITVKDADEEDAALAQGYGEYQAPKSADEAPAVPAEPAKPAEPVH